LSDSEQQLKVPVEQLCQGMYVDALDRPWVETPFLFQGFKVTDDDIATLEVHCRFVYVDLARSQSTAARRAQQAAQSAADEEAPRTSRRSLGGGQGPAYDKPFGGKREPDEAHFRELVQAAEAGRHQARQEVDRVMQDIRLGRSLDAARAREVVHELVHQVSADSSAALWLTNLKNRDEYTSIHCVNVCVFALAFGLHLGLDRDALTRLGLGALLHDVGKTKTPDEILNKTGQLTDDEFEVVKRHAEDGYQIMRDTGGVADDALAVIRHHHERMAGTGYPLGLTGTDIPLHVRVAGLADAYDAMTSDRSYQTAMAADNALHKLYRRGADMFGDEMVQEFIRCVGIFPVGSVVELDNGAVGVVVATGADARLQPTLLLVRTPDGHPYDKRVLVNLAAETRRGEGDAPCRIVRARNPASVDVDVPAIVADEFGLAEGG
jgi:putative nucleotidyltransferase with HDIG domain